MNEVFIIQNVSANTIELIDFGMKIPPLEIVELMDFDQTVLSAQLNTYLQNGSVVRLINDSSVPYSEAYSTTIQIYQFDSSSVDASINTLYLQNLSQDASILLKPLTTYVDGSLNAKVNRTLFDSSILSLTNKDLSHDASLALRPLTTYVDGSLNAKTSFTYVDGSLNVKTSFTYVDGSLNFKVNRTLFDSSILVLTNKDLSQDASILLRPLTTYVDGSLNARVKKTGDIMTGDLVFSGSAFLRRDNSSNRIAIYGGTGESDGAYFQVTGSNYASSPGGRSAEFIIGELPASKYALFSYDGIGTWTERFSLIGSSGLVRINNDASIGGSIFLGNCSSIGGNLPYAQIDVNNGNKIIGKGNYYGQEFQYEESLGISSTTSTSPQTKVSLTTPNLPAGIYKIEAAAKGRANSTNADMIFDVTLNGNVLDTIPINIEPQDAASYYPIYMKYFVSISGVNTILFRYRGETAGNTVYIADATLELIRVQ